MKTKRAKRRQLLDCKTKHTRRLEQDVCQDEGSIPSVSTDLTRNDVVIAIKKKWLFRNIHWLYFQLKAIGWIAKTFKVAIIIRAQDKVEPQVKFKPSLRLVLRKDRVASK